MRLNHYPVVQDAGADSFGVSHHKDSGFLTVLLQDDQVPGLQVQKAPFASVVLLLFVCLLVAAGNVKRYCSSTCPVFDCSTARIAQQHLMFIAQLLCDSVH